MPQQTLTHEELFNQIKSAKQTVTYSLSLFGEQPHISFPEYWRLVDIRNFIDIKRFPYNIDTKRETAPNWSNMPDILYKYTPQNILCQIPNEYEWKYDHIRKSNNQGYEISRFLSWAVMKYSDRYDNTSFQQAYFLSPGQELPEIEQLSAKLDRVKLREWVIGLQKQFNGIIYKVGGNYKQIFNDMYTALFQTATPTKHLGDKPVAEYMSGWLLQKYGETLLTIIQRWNNYCSNKNNLYFANIVTQEMSNTRRNTPGGHPEQYLIGTTVSKVISEISNTEKEFINKYAIVQSK